MAAWAGRALLDGARFAERRADLWDEGPGGRAAAIRLDLARTALVMAGEAGYEAMVVEELIERAATNRARFYEAFAGKEACFAEAYVAGAEALAERLLGAGYAAGGWAAGMRAALEELVRFVVAEPAVARGLLAEPGGAGAVVAAKRDEVFGRLSRAIDRARRETIRSRHPVPPFTSRFILGTIETAVLKFLADPAGRSFEAELPGLLYLVVDFYLGPEAAREQVRELGSAD